MPPPDNKTLTYESPPLTITEESGYCAGHFPGHPIVPAAAQLHWVLGFIEKNTGHTAEQLTLRTMKCHHELQPGDTPCIHIDHHETRINAKLAAADRIFSEYRFHTQQY